DLREIGVRPGTAVAVQLPCGPGMAAGMFASWLSGAVFVPLNARQTVREVAHVVEQIRPAAVLDRDGLRRLDGAAPFEADVAFVTWTSGTTGPPKPILQTHSGYREILGRVLGSIRKSPATERPSPNLVPVSLALNAGIYNVLFGLMAGAAVVLMDRFNPQDFAALVKRYGIRSTVLPPAAMAMLTAADDVTDLAPLRYLRSITAPLTPLSARRFMAKFDVTVLNGYGQAEIGEVIGWTAADAREHPEKLGAVGRPHAGVDVKVVDEDGHAVDSGTSGQLLVRPPRMAAGYAGGDSLSERIDDDGYVRTGDYATVDDDGFVWIEGRTSDLINRGGNKVFPDQVEEVLLLHPQVRDAAVAGVPDDRLGEVPVAFIVGDARQEELLALCRENLVPYKIPVAFERVLALPRSEVGKILRRELAGRWVGSEGGPESPTRP
ncbi:MAG TPA: fatty acid--CoA ligase family protein, partial [Acidimicrobiales bacterium]|nr:fatty acid--CoA ligase family protein [Acidimicrobiales bacterium]